MCVSVLFCSQLVHITSEDELKEKNLLEFDSEYIKYVRFVLGYVKKGHDGRHGFVPISFV